MGALDAKDGKLVGAEKRGDKTVQLTGKPEPALNGSEKVSWGA